MIACVITNSGSRRRLLALFIAIVFAIVIGALGILAQPAQARAATSSSTQSAQARSAALGNALLTQSDEATLSSKAKKAYLVKLAKIQKQANSQGTPPFNGSNKVIYRFLDVDRDGKKEMLVESSTKKSEISSYVHAAVYKYKSGKVKRIMVDCGWASWMESFRCYYPKTRTLVTSFYHNSISESSMVYHWNGKKFEFIKAGSKYKKGKVVKLNKGWKVYHPR